MASCDDDVMCGVMSTVHVQQGEACEIRENTRPSLMFAAELLGVEADQLEKAAVSKTMAVSGGGKGSEMTGWYAGGILKKEEDM